MASRDFVLYNRTTQVIREYPRDDDQPVVGLADPPWMVLRVVHEQRPEVHDPLTHELREKRTVDEAAAQWIIGWELVPLPPPPPDYEGFYLALLESTTYRDVLGAQGKSGDQAAALAVFVSNIHSAMAERPVQVTLQQSIWAMVAAMGLSADQKTEVQNLMVAHGMAGLYTLEPPKP